MKKRMLMLLIFVITCATVVSVFAFSALAADEEIVVGYYETQSGKVKQVAVPNEDGSYTIRDTQFSKASTVTLADGSVVDRELYGWFTEDGEFYTPGEVVFFTESTKLFQAFGVTVYNFDDLKKAFSAGGWVRLGCDIEGNAALTNGQTTSILDLNGHTYTCKNETGNTWGAELGVFGCTRGSYAIMGSGTIIQNERTKDKNGEYFAKFATHGYADENNPQDFWVGKNVKIVTPYVLLNVSNQPKLGMPDMKIAGTIEAKTLLSGPSMQEGTVDIFESADITLTGTEMIKIDTLNANPYTYLTVTIHGGKIRMDSENSEIVTDKMIECCNINIHGGSFAISEAGIEKLTPYISDPLVLKTTVIDDVTYQTVSEPDCMHNFVLDTQASVTATKTENGKDVFVCSVCGEAKEMTTVYNPCSDMITVKVLVEDIVVEKTVALDSVATIEKSGAGADTVYVITAFAQADSEGNALVSVQVPFGISKVALTGANNTTIEELELADGADVRVAAVHSLKALKTIKIGAAKVVFSAGCLSANNSAFDSVVSNKAGATVTFEKQAFYYYTNNGVTVVNGVVMSSGSTYNFGESSFSNACMESVIFPDGATINFTGNSAFNNCKYLKYIYCGDGITKLNYRPFEYLYALECVVIMNASVLDDCAFRVNDADSSTTELSVYIHTEDITSIHKNAFYKRNVYGVKFYTIDPDIVSLQNCAYTIYSGIPHAYKDGVVREPSCILPGIVGSTTDCPCGVNEVVTYTIYTAEGTTTGTTEQRETELSDVHVLGGDLFAINYPNGYDAQGVREYYCGLCGVATLEDETDIAAPLFECMGYSVSETTCGSVVIGYMINLEIASEINAISNTAVKYGVFAVSQAKLGENQIFDENGNTTQGVLYAYISNTSHAAFEIKVTGFTTDAQKSVQLALGAFVELTRDEDKEYYYVQPGDAAEGEKYYFASYNEMVELTK